MRGGLLHIRAEGADWIVQSDDPPGTLSRHDSLYEAECAAAELADDDDQLLVVVHDRYARARARRPAALAHRPR